MAGEISPHGVRRTFGALERKKMAINVDTLLRVHSTISNGFARNHVRIQMLQFGVCGLPFWLASSPCCGKITSLPEKQELSIFTTAYFVGTWYSSHKHKLFGCVADLERPTSFPLHTLSHVAIHWWQIVPGTGVQCTLGGFPLWFWATTGFHVWRSQSTCGVVTYIPG